MPRLARAVFPNIPHHIAQRGNRREDVFFSDEGPLLSLGVRFQKIKHLQ